MITRQLPLRPCSRPLLNLPTRLVTPQQQQHRPLHHTVPLKPVPVPTPFVPDHETFLKLIGRDLSQHASKIGTWHNLFTLTSPQLAALGVEPARSRRYLLRWREKFRKGEYGIGGDMTEVVDGVGEVRVVEVPRTNATTAAATAKTGAGAAQSASRTAVLFPRKIAVNVPAGSSTSSSGSSTRAPLRHLAQTRVLRSGILAAPHLRILPGTTQTAGTISVAEGLWEVKRGRKIDGGERRRAEVRAKRMAAQNRARREAAALG